MFWVDDEFFTSKEAALEYMRGIRNIASPKVYEDMLFPMGDVVSEKDLKSYAQHVISIACDFIPEVCGEDGDALDTGKSLESLTNHLTMWLNEVGKIHCPSDRVVDTSDWGIWDD